MIIYSLSAGGNLSIADLFTAGVVPGLMLAAALMLAAWLVARRRGYPAGVFPGWRMIAVTFASAFPGILLIGIIFGGVRSGVFTATESSCVAVVYALLITVFVYRALSWEAFVEATLGAVRTTAMVLLVIGCAAAFGWLMALLQVPAQAVAFMKGITDNPFMMLMLINVALLGLGTFMDMAPMIIICTPIFLPVVTAFGIDPIHFGVILILNAGIGLNTPPVGSVQFVACAIGKVSIGDSMKTIWPFYGASVAVLLLVTYVPAFSLWLPALFK
jgi:tripartite ATP-independent transporter DctM subunit